MIKFICYPKSSPCQKAKKWLDDNKIEYEFRDIKLDNPTLDELTKWHAKRGKSMLATSALTIRRALTNFKIV